MATSQQAAALLSDQTRPLKRRTRPGVCTLCQYTHPDPDNGGASCELATQHRDQVRARKRARKATYCTLCHYKHADLELGAISCRVAANFRARDNARRAKRVTLCSKCGYRHPHAQQQSDEACQRHQAQLKARSTSRTQFQVGLAVDASRKRRAAESPTRRAARLELQRSARNRQPPLSSNQRNAKRARRRAADAERKRVAQPRTREAQAAANSQNRLRLREVDSSGNPFHPSTDFPQRSERLLEFRKHRNVDNMFGMLACMHLCGYNAHVGACSVRCVRQVDHANSCYGCTVTIPCPNRYVQDTETTLLKLRGAIVRAAASSIHCA